MSGDSRTFVLGSPKIYAREHKSVHCCSFVKRPALLEPATGLPLRTMKTGSKRSRDRICGSAATCKTSNIVVFCWVIRPRCSQLESDICANLADEKVRPFVMSHILYSLHQRGEQTFQIPNAFWWWCTYILYYHIISYYIILYHIISYYIILYHIISYYIILYHIISYYIILYHIISYYIILYHIISYYIILYHIISYYIILYHIISYYFILYHIISYYFILFHIISYYFILYHIISYYIILYHIKTYYIILYLTYSDNTVGRGRHVVVRLLAAWKFHCEDQRQ